MQTTGLPLSTDEAIAKVEASPNPAEGFVYVGDAAKIRYAAMTNCLVEQVGPEFSLRPYALATQKGDSLNSKISMAYASNFVKK